VTSCHNSPLISSAPDDDECIYLYILLRIYNIFILLTILANLKKTERCQLITKWIFQNRPKAISKHEKEETPSLRKEKTRAKDKMK
jgi:hypothetical protein